MTTIVNARGTSATDHALALWRDALDWQRALDATVAPLGLTHTQYLVLHAVDELARHSRELVSQRAIARRAGFDETMTSRLVRRMCERGWLTRGGTEGDQRAYEVVVTSQGRRILSRAAPRVEKASRGFLAERKSRVR